MNKMVKTLFFGFVLPVFLAGCGGGAVVDEFGNVSFGVEAVTFTPSILSSPTIAISATPTVSPTAAVDYAATAVIAQQTADEARRLNTQATAEHEQRIQEQIRLTAEQDARVFEQASWTAMAALTAIPATATQQDVINKQIETQQVINIARITQTFEAPAKLIEMQNAEEYVQYAPARVFGMLFLQFSAGVAFLFMAAFLWRQPQWSKAARDKMLEDYLNETGENQAGGSGEAGSSSNNETVVVMKKETGGGFESSLRMVVPCSPEQLCELAEGLLNQGKTFGINQWEGRGTLLTRETIKLIRNFFQTHRFVQSGGGGSVVLTDDGRAFLRGWLENQNLPTSFSFGSENGANHGVMAHEYENHGVSHTVGEVLTTPSVPTGHLPPNTASRMFRGER